MMAVFVFQEAYGESGDPFDLSKIGDTEIRMVKYLHFYARCGLIVGYLVGGSDIHC
jgi:hypothetical protein